LSTAAVPGNPDACPAIAGTFPVFAADEQAVRGGQSLLSGSAALIGTARAPHSYSALYRVAEVAAQPPQAAVMAVCPATAIRP
jgi:hypothetical protein